MSIYSLCISLHVRVLAYDFMFMIRPLASYLASAYVAFIMFPISIMLPITTVNVHMGEPVNHQRNTSSIAVDVQHRYQYGSTFERFCIYTHIYIFAIADVIILFCLSCVHKIHVCV